jgi:hypothetical protein
MLWIVVLTLPPAFIPFLWQAMEQRPGQGGGYGYLIDRHFEQGVEV